MKRNKLSILLMLVTFICTAFIGCASTGKSAGANTNKAAKNGYLTTEGGKAVFNNVDYDGNAAVFGKGIDGYDNVMLHGAPEVVLHNEGELREYFNHL